MTDRLPATIWPTGDDLGRPVILPAAKSESSSVGGMRKMGLNGAGRSSSTTTGSGVSARAVERSEMQQWRRSSTRECTGAIFQSLLSPWHCRRRRCAALGGRSAGIALAQSTESPDTSLLAPTPECGDADDLTATLPQTAGPFYTPDTPERSLLEPEMPGTRRWSAAMSTECQPIPGALLDFWQADDTGVYDNQGYRLRGHQFADEDGRFELETIVPGLYPGTSASTSLRRRRISHAHHAALLSRGTGQCLGRDIQPALVMDVQEAEDGEVAFFTFVLAGEGEKHPLSLMSPSLGHPL